MSSAVVSEAQEAALDLYGLYARNTACGYHDDLTFSASEVQAMTARLRGAAAISSLMIATINREEFAVSELVQSGLVEAMHALTSDVQKNIEKRNNLVQEAKEAACATV